MALTPTLRIGVLADLQGSYREPFYFPTHGEQIRRPDTGLSRLQQTVDTFNEEGVDLIVDLGDLVDSSCSTYREEYIDKIINGSVDASEGFEGVSSYNSPWMTISGNHEEVVWSHSVQSETDIYLNVINPVHIERENVYIQDLNDHDYYPNYTYDIGGYRFVCLSEGEMDTALRPDDIWFKNRLDESPYPVIVCSHNLSWENSTRGWQRVDHAYLTQVMVDSGKVQCALAGHSHWGDGDAWLASYFRGYNFFASQWAPLEEDNAYYIMEFVPNQIKTDNGWKSQIRIIGYGTLGGRKAHAYYSTAFIEV